MPFAPEIRHDTTAARPLTRRLRAASGGWHSITDQLRTAKAAARRQGWSAPTPASFAKSPPQG